MHSLKVTVDSLTSFSSILETYSTVTLTDLLFHVHYLPAVLSCEQCFLGEDPSRTGPCTHIGNKLSLETVKLQVRALNFILKKKSCPEAKD